LEFFNAVWNKEKNYKGLVKFQFLLTDIRVISSSSSG